MRFKELLEYKRDITTTNLGEQLVQAITRATQGAFSNSTKTKLKQIIPGIEISSDRSDDNVTQIMAALGAYINEVLKFFEDADPTANKQYTEWIIRRFIDGGIRYLEDVDSTVAENLAIYHELKVRRKIPPELMDINKFKGDANPNSVVRFFRNVYNIYRELPEQVEKAKGNAKEIYSDEEIRVVQPMDKEASCYYGQGTQWCTASTKSTNYFHHYSEQGYLYIVLPKKPEHEGEKYQLHFGSNFYANENDVGVKLTTLMNRWPQLHKLFHDEYSDQFMSDDGEYNGTIYLATPETLANWEDIVDDTITPIIEKHLETPVSVYNWAGFATIEAGIKEEISLDGWKHTAKMKLKVLDHITKHISSNKEVSRAWIIDTIFDLDNIDQMLDDQFTVPKTTSLSISKILPDITEILGDNRVASGLKYTVVKGIWNTIKKEINPYFGDAFTKFHTKQVPAIEHNE